MLYEYGKQTRGCGRYEERRSTRGSPGKRGPRAPEELVERHHAELYRYARALLRDTPAAEDAVQDAFERAFVALGRYSLERIESLALRPWLYRITLNVVRNAWRDGRREVPVAATPERIRKAHRDGGRLR